MVKHTLFFVFLLCRGILADLPGQELFFEKTLKSGFSQHIGQVSRTAAGDLLMSWVSAPSLSYSSVPQAVLTDSLGNIKWLKNVVGSRYSYLRDSVGNMAFFGTPFFCDWCATGVYGEWNYQLVDAAGRDYAHERVNHYMWDVNVPYHLLPFPLPVGAVLSADGWIISAGNNYLQRVKATGVSYIYDTLPFIVRGLFSYGASTGLMVSSDHFYEINSAAEITAAYPLNYSVESIKDLGEGRLLVFSGDSCMVTDTTGTILGTYRNRGDFSSIRDVRLREDAFWILGKSGGEYRIKQWRDTAYTIQLSMDTTDFEPVAFEIWSKHLIVLGYEYTGQNRHIIMRSIPLDGSAGDDGALDVSLDAIVAVDSYETSCISIPEITRKGSFFKVKVQLTNHSEKEINTLALNVKWTPWYLNNTYCVEWCYEPRYSSGFGELHLAPGESTEILLGPFHDGQLSGKKTPFCVWVSAPDGKRDPNAGNDMLCDEFSVGEAPVEAPASYQVFPNPAGTGIRLTGQGMATMQYRLFDITGKLWGSGTLYPSGIIDTEQLAPGMYFLKIDDNHSPGVLHFIKD